MDSYNDKDNIGIGSWFIIHTTAMKAKSHANKILFQELMKILEKNFPCHYCREHMKKFMEKEPLKNYNNKCYKDIDKDAGYFYWSWKLHNEVNKRLGKKLVSFHDAYNYFSNLEENVCYNCGGINKNLTKKEISYNEFIKSNLPKKITFL